MRCDRILTALAAGGPFARWRAAQHLARCPACSAAAEGQSRLIDALADAPPLTEPQRQSWMRAADEAAPINSRPEVAKTGWHALAEREHDSTSLPAHAPREHAIRRRLAIAASILGLLGFGAWLATRPARLGTSPVVAVMDPSSVKQITLRELDALRTDTASLSRELDDLLREVDLLDARREVDALQFKFASNGGRAGP